MSSAGQSSSNTTVRLELSNLSGAAITATTLTLPPKAQVAKFLNQLAVFQNLCLPIQGLLRISSALPIAAVGLRSRTNERGDFLITTTPPVAETSPAIPELFFRISPMAAATQRNSFCSAPARR